MQRISSSAPPVLQCLPIRPPTAKITITNMFESIAQAIPEQTIQYQGVDLCIKRLDLVHPQISGNKFYKLKYNFIDFEECLSKPLNECSIKLDMSLMPKYKNKGEYI